MEACAVGFDLDDTLVDHGRAARTAISVWLATRGLADVDAHPTIADSWMELEKRHFGDYVAGRVEFAEHRRRRLRGMLELVGQPALASSTDHALDALFDEYRTAYASSWVLFDDVVPALVRLRDLAVPVAVLTNGQPGQQHEKLERTGLAPFVDVLLTVSDVPAPKPDPRAFATLCARLRVAPAQVVFVGDDLEVDVDGAAAAGIRAVHLDRTGLATRSPRHPTIGTLTDLELR